MKNKLIISLGHSVTEANINYYAKPFVHPTRKMTEHDFIYMLKGKWKIGQNEEVFELKEDSLLILAANNSHFGVEPCSPDTKTMYFHLSCEEETAAENKGEEYCITESLIDASANRNIKKYFYETVNAKICGNQRKADIFSNLLLCELDEANLHQGSLLVAEQMKDIIHKNPERFFGNKELAERVHVSVKTAENKFKALFGMTVHQYILKFKTEQAVFYFKNFPEMSIKEIAYNLGFYDEYHFSKQFKKKTGVSPVKYKESVIEKK